MLCSQIQLRTQGIEYTTVKLLPCRSWGCENCAEQRKRQLMAIAASGKPTVCLTLTHVNTETSDPVQDYKELHAAWKMLVKRILRQFLKPAEKRWMLQTEEGYEYQEIRGYRITRKTKERIVKRLHYMAFAEATEKGEPHLHILLRTQYIPQAWISQQMRHLISSPVIWIEKVKSARAAIAYVCKYVSKAPAQFGRSRRYWLSRHYQVSTPEKYQKEIVSRRTFRVIRQSFRELITEIVRNNLIPQVMTRTEIRLYTLKEARYSDGTGSLLDDAVRCAKAYVFTESWRKYFRI